MINTDYLDLFKEFFSKISEESLISISNMIDRELQSRKDNEEKI